MTSGRSVSSTNQPRLPPIASLQAGRALAALAVLLYHTNITLNLPKYLGRDIAPFFNSGDFGVHFFFVLSGFIICYTHMNDVGQTVRLLPFILKRLRRLIPALWATLILVLCAYWLWPALGGADVTIWKIVSAFLILPAERENLLAVEWTLRHEVLFYVVFGLIVWSPRVGISVFCAWLLLSATLPWLEFGFPTSFFFATYHVLFGLGALTAIAHTKKLVQWPGTSTVFGVALFFSAWMLKPFEVNSNFLTLVLGVGAALIVGGTSELERRGKIRIHRSILFLGDASYSIYLVHFVAISAMCKLVMLAPRFVATPDVIAFLVVAGGALMSGIIFYLFVERPLLAALSFRSVRALHAHAPVN